MVTSSNGSSSGAYVYDGNGLRVKKCIPNCSSATTTTRYIYSGSKVIAEYDNGAATTSPSREYLYAGGLKVATLVSSTPTYHLRDHLSVRVNTDNSGSIIGEQGHYPFGDSWYLNSTTTKEQFTTYERDGESGNDYAMARYNVNRLGRFSSVDPLSGGLGNPQSLNHYAYSLNDPINLADPTGMSADAEQSAGPNSCGDARVYDPKCAAWEGVNPAVDAAIAGFYGNEGSIDSFSVTAFGGCGVEPKDPPCEIRWFNPDYKPYDFSSSDLEMLRRMMAKQPTSDVVPGGGGGGGLAQLKSAACSAVPTGRVISIGASAGTIGGVTGSIDMVINYTSGQVSLFRSGGGFAGYNGGGSAYASTGDIYGNLAPNNSNFSGSFKTVSGSGAHVGGSIATSNGLLITSISVSATVIPGDATGMFAKTSSSQPTQLGALASLAAFALNPIDQSRYLLRQLCK